MTPQSPPSVLVVEDESPIRDMLAELLIEQGHAVRTCENGLAALGLMAAEPSDIVISDLIMPECDGLELQLAIRKKWPQTHFIAISAPNNFSSLEASASLGAHATFEKPLDINELVETVGLLARDLHENQT